MKEIRAHWRGVVFLFLKGCICFSLLAVNTVMVFFCDVDEERRGRMRWKWCI